MSDTETHDRLRHDDLPPPGADWADIREFALTFDGYEHAKRLKPDADPFEVCSGLAKRLRSAVERTGRLPAARTLDDLRAALFWWQRAVRWSDTEVPPDETLHHCRVLIETMRDRLGAGDP